MTTKTFAELNLIEPICLSLQKENYISPTPIQEQCIPHLLQGGDLLGCAQTGTGKTAAFALPILQRLFETPKRNEPNIARALILTPTRELAIQIGESFEVYGRNLNLRQTVIFGGVSDRPQIAAMAQGVDILIATPGRLLDLINRCEVNLRFVETFVLDEADRMLDMGFIRDIRKILSRLPVKRQTLLFSATMPKEIQELTVSILDNPKHVSVVPAATTADKIEERVMFVEKSNKFALLLDILKDTSIRRILVFTRTKHGANKLSDNLGKYRIRSAAIHGNKSQNARQNALEDFRESKLRVLVATDIFARGIDIDGITHVVNYDLPNEPESYVHRIGRTARAGESGVAISFCDSEERAYLNDIEKILKRRVAVVAVHPYRSEAIARDYIEQKKAIRPPQGNQGRGGRRPSSHRSGQRHQSRSNGRGSGGRGSRADFRG